MGVDAGRKGSKGAVGLGGAGWRPHCLIAGIFRETGRIRRRAREVPQKPPMGPQGAWAGEAGEVAPPQLPAPVPGHLKEAPGPGSRLSEQAPSRAHAGPLCNTEGVAPIAGQSHCTDPGVAPIAGAAPGRRLVRAGVADPRPRARER